MLSCRGSARRSCRRATKSTRSAESGTRRRSWRARRRNLTRRRMPGRHDAGPRRHVPGAGIPAAIHRRLPARIVARRRSAPSAPREVSGCRHPQPHRTDAGHHCVADSADGCAEHPRAEQSERRIRRCACAAREVHQEHAARGSLHCVRERPEPVSRRGRGLRHDGRGAARGRREERRDRPQDLQRDRHGHEKGRRHAAGDQRSRAVADLGDSRAAEHSGHHPHRGTAGVFRAARHAQRTMARAGALR